MLASPALQSGPVGLSRLDLWSATSTTTSECVLLNLTGISQLALLCCKKKFTSKWFQVGNRSRLDVSRNIEISSTKLGTVMVFAVKFYSSTSEDQGCFESTGNFLPQIRCHARLFIESDASSPVSGSMSVNLLSREDTSTETVFLNCQGIQTQGTCVQFTGKEDKEGFILQREKVRRLKLSQANKGRAPWNKGKKIKGGASDSLDNTRAVSDECNISLKEQQRRQRISLANKGKIPWNKGLKPAEEMDETTLLIKEKQRRLRISLANTGKVPWNKGGKHSDETKKRIRERTIEAMKNPEIRRKLQIHGHSQSLETRARISAALSQTLEVKRQLRKAQESCLNEWKEMIAEAARVGGDGDVMYQWDSYTILKDELQRAWRSAKKKVGGPPKSSDHRAKISEAIKAKWADPEYRCTVKRGITAFWEERGKRPKEMKRRKQPVRKTPRLPKVKPEVKSVIPGLKAAAIKVKPEVKAEAPVLKITDRETSIENVYVLKDQAEPKSTSNGLVAYRNPLSDMRLEKLKQIRANRLSVKIKRMEATEKARLLMAEAQKAARVLEAAAVKDKKALAPLLEAQRLLAEAARSFETARLDS